MYLLIHTQKQDGFVSANSSLHVRLRTAFTSPLRILLPLFFHGFLNVFALSEINGAGLPGRLLDHLTGVARCVGGRR